ncbi:endonuclease/exonuclease/phosphatase family protein [Microtetraspora sp. NBRC 16547]|uniref:endonuclease/exonuclease/phosphatase family protein n=1 Tax=Microtetraspora sp. NBRC 16547 TaxID=3030993 RepID=UPI0025543E97|nr:endonuclease/exonuclease/phosphatase family protein [Microtetraspora sp. NBRC 16547]
MRSARDDRRALVRVIRAIRPDVLCVQEAPALPGRRRRLARDAGMTIAAGERPVSARLAGVAVLTGPAVRLLHAEQRRLRWFPGLEPRAVALAVVEKDGLRLVVCSFHLDLHRGARLRHAAEIMPIADRLARLFGAHAVLCGDVNEEPAGPTWRYLASRFTDCYAKAPKGDGGTYSARRPAKRIDGIFAAPELTVARCGAADAAPADLVAATDHRPVVADLCGRRSGEGTGEGPAERSGEEQGEGSGGTSAAGSAG